MNPEVSTSVPTSTFPSHPLLETLKICKFKNFIIWKFQYLQFQNEKICQFQNLFIPCQVSPSSWFIYQIIPSISNFKHFLRKIRKKMTVPNQIEFPRNCFQLKKNFKCRDDLPKLHEPRNPLLYLPQLHKFQATQPPTILSPKICKLENFIILKFQYFTLQTFIYSKVPVLYNSKISKFLHSMPSHPKISIFPSKMLKIRNLQIVDKI